MPSGYFTLWLCINAWNVQSRFKGVILTVFFFLCFLQISKLIETINTQMQSKGRELTEYRERYNIRLVGEGEGDAQGQTSAPSSEGSASKSGTGVLVS